MGGPGGPGDRVLFELALGRYQSMLRNVTTRLQTAEKAVELLRQRQEALQAQSVISPAQAVEVASAAVAGAASVAAAAATHAEKEEEESSSEEESTEFGGELEDDDEDSPAVKAQKEKEQRELIGFDAVTNTYRRYRSDFKCGDRVPALPDGEPVECDPTQEHPCCSSLGWCGKSSLHCECDGCVDHSSKVKLSVKTIKLVEKERECADIVYNFEMQESARVCADLVLKQMECGHHFMFSEIYPEWGCRCCASGTAGGEEKKPEWSVWKIEANVKWDSPKATSESKSASAADEEEQEEALDGD